MDRQMVWRANFWLVAFTVESPSEKIANVVLEEVISFGSAITTAPCCLYLAFQQAEEPFLREICARVVTPYSQLCP